MAIVYKHIRKDTDKVFYIGIGQNIDRAYSKQNRNEYWYNIVNKVGYSIEIIETDLDWNEACEREKYWIKFYGRFDLNEGTLVNMTDGGEGNIGLIRTNEHSSKISNTLKSKGIIPPCQKGNVRSEETKKIISEKNKGRVLTNETRAKIAYASANRSDEARKNKSEGLKAWWAARKAKMYFFHFLG